MATDTPLSAYNPLYEYRILRVSNFLYLCELCITLSVIVQPIPLYTVSFFTKHPACLEHHQVWLSMLSHSSNSATPTFVRYALPSLLVLMVPLVQRVSHSFECQSWILAPLSDSFPYISMPVSPKRSRVLVALHTAQLGPSCLHDKCFYVCLSRFETICHELSWFCLSRVAPLRVRL
ncbi:hypothetical protein B296_00040529 [Ensete ventricosum]|uniref:Uncharacterized protein n=1 Tax=Ensete ventricosum TaxID=4639 RepID=A0A426X5I2_ENSVE|nr:hypothetical protein B296_00040529 [Ensete ventricosum]